MGHLAMKVLMCDPPSGWQYGFPKPCPRNLIGDKEFQNWLVKNGYPQHLVDKGLTKYTRWWEADISEAEYKDWLANETKEKENVQD